MKLRGINNFFGDMDLYLMDYILKGNISDGVRVLDIGCGEGRNAIYFINQGFDYLGIDKDPSKVSLANYVSDQISRSKARFEVCELNDFSTETQFDFIICSRFLHFSLDEKRFMNLLRRIKDLLSKEGVLYFSMDSVVDINPSFFERLKKGQVRFPDGKTRFALTKNLYQSILKEFVEVETLRTTIHDHNRSQSFAFLRKR